MTKLIFIIACLLSGSAWGQLISSPKAFKSLTEEQFYEVFGSVSAYNFEEGLEIESSHHRLVMLIGAKLWWLQEIPYYMVEQLGCSPEIDGDKRAIHGHFGVHSGFGNDNSVLEIRAHVDDIDSMHITDVTMTGNTELLIQLFINYWEHSEIKFVRSKLKKGVLFYENYGSDRICFNWKGAKPTIIIKTNPNFPTLMPLAAEHSGK